MNINQKDIVLLPYPFTDLQGAKVRPALVVSNDALNRKSEDCILVPLTTVLKEEPYSIIITPADLSFGKLIQQSRIRVDKIFSVQKRLIITRIGTLKEDIFEKVKDELGNIF